MLICGIAAVRADIVSEKALVRSAPPRALVAGLVLHLFTDKGLQAGAGGAGARCFWQSCILEKMGWLDKRGRSFKSLLL